MGGGEETGASLPSFLAGTVGSDWVRQNRSCYRLTGILCPLCMFTANSDRLIGINKRHRNRTRAQQQQQLRCVAEHLFSCLYGGPDVLMSDVCGYHTAVHKRVRRGAFSYIGVGGHGKRARLRTTACDRLQSSCTRTTSVAV